MFSENLINKLQIYFTKRSGKEITKEEAESYLNSYADYFMIVREFNNKNTNAKH
jgi:hypothetical protein